MTYHNFQFPIIIFQFSIISCTLITGENVYIIIENHLKTKQIKKLLLSIALMATVLSGYAADGKPVRVRKTDRS